MTFDENGWYAKTGNAMLLKQSSTTGQLNIKSGSEIGEEISEKLYNAVAIALAYVYRIDKGEDIDEPNIDVPEDLRFNENGSMIKENFNA